MNIVIVGAGNIGQYVARVLSQEKFSVTLIEEDPLVLKEIADDLDVALKQGNGTDWEVLDQLLESRPTIFMALTGSDETNLIACNIAKSLGYPRTLARVGDTRYLNQTRLNFSSIFLVDHFVGPELLVANDIFKYLSSPGSIAVESFAHGAVQMRTLVIPEKWRKGDKTIEELALPEGVMAGLIRRKVPSTVGGTSVSSVIFPHSDDSIMAGDEVTFIGETDIISDIHFLFGSTKSMVRSVVLLGGSLTAVNLAKILERQGVHVRLIEQDYKRCCELAEILKKTVILHSDGCDIDFLRSEKVERTDVFIACTDHDNLNILAALAAKEVGVKDMVIMLSDSRLSPIVKQQGVYYTASPRVSATNRILSIVRDVTVSSMVAVYDKQAEVVELNVSAGSKMVGIPIAELNAQLPRDFRFAVIQNRGRIIIANGNRVLSPGDTVIAVTHPKHLSELERVF